MSYRDKEVSAAISRERAIGHGRMDFGRCGARVLSRKFADSRVGRSLHNLSIASLLSTVLLAGLMATTQASANPAATAPSATRAPAPGVFNYLDSEPRLLFRSQAGSSAQAASIGSATSNTSTQRTVIRVSKLAAQNAVISGRLPVVLPDGTSYDLRVEREELADTGDWTLVSRVDTPLGGLAAVITYGRDGVFGVLPKPDGGLLQISTSRGETILETAGGMLPPGQELTSETSKDYLAPPPQAPAMTTGFMSDAQAEAIAAEGDVQIDVLGIYTTDLVALRGSASAAETEFTNLLAIANQAFIDSGTVVRLNLVGLRETNYPGTATNADVSTRLISNALPDGLNVRQIRIGLAADLVALLRPFQSGDTTCGIATVAGSGLQPQSSRDDLGFSVSNVAPCGPYVLAHQLGHNLGSQHDIQTATGIDGKVARGAYIFSHGYRQDGPPAFATIMATPVGGQQWVGYFSHPNTTLCQGVACGIAEEADNARSINLMAPRVARTLDPPGMLSIHDVSIVESDSGTSQLRFMVMLQTPAPTGGVRFDIATRGGTATANSDYLPRNLTGQFIPEGQNFYVFDVMVNGDSVVEPDETFFVDITNVVGAGVFVAQAVGTIRNDDPKVRLSGQARFQAGLPVPTDRFRIQFLVNDGINQTTQQVWLSPPDFRYEVTVAKGVRVSIKSLFPPSPFFHRTVDVGVLDADTTYDITLEKRPILSGRVVFPLGYAPPTESFAITIIDNIEGGVERRIVVQPPEFRYEIDVFPFAPIGVKADRLPAPFITPNFFDPTPVLIDTTRDINVEVGVMLSGVLQFPAGATPPDRPVQVDITPCAVNASICSNNGGGHFDAYPPDFRFSTVVRPGLPINFVVMVPSPFANLRRSVDAITVDSQVGIDVPFSPELSIADAQVIEGNDGTTTANFVVTLSSPAPIDGVGVVFDTADGTATASDDYIASRQGFVIQEGVSSITIAVQVRGDTIAEPDETFELNAISLSNARPRDVQAIGTILSDDNVSAPALSISDAWAIEGNSDTTTMTFTVGLSRPAPAGGVSFDIATTDGTAKAGSDYVAKSVVGLSIAAGQTSASFTVIVNGDTIGERDEMFNIVVSNVVGATLADGHAAGTIINDEEFITPVTNPDHYTVERNRTLAIDAVNGVLANDSYALGTVVHEFGPQGPEFHGTLSLSEDGSFTYTPNANFSGEDGFFYQACHGFQCSLGRVTLSIGFTLDPADRYIWMLPPASNLQQQGFVRLSNRSDNADLVTLWGVDATGRRSSGTVSLTLAPRESRQLNSQDLEQGNLAKGVTGGLGIGTGNWTLVVHSALDLEALAYIRTPDGFLTPIHDRVDGDGVDWFVPMFNPAENPNQVSRLRVINTSLQAVSLQILGVDDAGAVGAGPVAVTVAALSSIELTSADLENGNAAKGLIGKLGNGTGKWHLSVSATGRVTLQSLLLDPKGYLTNLSTLPDLTERVPGERTLWLVPPASNVQQQGFVRLSNRENRASDVALWGIDDAGRRSTGTITLRLTPRQSLQLTSQDLEAGNPDKGVTGSLGSGTGNWRLVVLTDLDLMPMGLIRTPDGFLTTVHDTVAGDGLNTRVPMFNPADNPNQVSALRLVNPNNANVSLTIRGVDDAGRASNPATLTLAANAAVEVSATELEQGNAAKGVTGGLGNGTGKWTLTVTASAPVKVMSLLRDPKGYLTNLSNGTQGTTDKLDQ